MPRINDVPEINKLKHRSTASYPAIKDGKTHSSSKLMHPFLNGQTQSSDIFLLFLGYNLSIAMFRCMLFV